MIPTRPLGSAFLLALALLLRSGVAAAAPAAKECDKQGAERAFLAGMRQYDKHCRDVIPRLEEAAKLCPAPEGPWSIRPNPFLEYSYLPYYFLAKCHYNLKDLPNALRHSYLASCLAEPARDKESTEDLGSLTAGCRKGLKSRQRPQQHPYFSEGFTAAQRQDWQASAEKMWDALQVWDVEDGETTLPSGRWPVSYLPRFRLAEALFNLGCFREACEQLDQSKLDELSTREKTKKQVERERQRMEKLKPECERRKSERYAEKEICQQWRCWLQQGGS